MKAPILITGGATRLGLALTEHYLKLERRVVITYRTKYQSIENFKKKGFNVGLIGDLRINLSACLEDSSNKFLSLPKQTSNDITFDSLNESIGGLVTCANCCLK